MVTQIVFFLFYQLFLEESGLNWKRLPIWGSQQEISGNWNIWMFALFFHCCYAVVIHELGKYTHTWVWRTWNSASVTVHWATRRSYKYSFDVTFYPYSNRNLIPQSVLAFRSLKLIFLSHTKLAVLTYFKRHDMWV